MNRLPYPALDIVLGADIREFVPATVAGMAVPGRAVRQLRISAVVSVAYAATGNGTIGMAAGMRLP